jgi:hypothetical protein
MGNAARLVRVTCHHQVILANRGYGLHMATNKATITDRLTICFLLSSQYNEILIMVWERGNKRS